MTAAPEPAHHTWQGPDLPAMRLVRGHHDLTPFLLTAEMYGGMPVELAGGEISDKVDRPVAATHTHAVPEIYVVVSAQPGGALIEVSCDGERRWLRSPATTYIPAGAEHCFVTREACPGSFCFGILLGTGEAVHP